MADGAELVETFETAYDLVREYAVRYKAAMGSECGLDIKVDADALWNLAQSYIDDITRYKGYHGTRVPDRARRCAYLCKWIMKFHPIVVMNSSASDDEIIRSFSLMANEMFAVVCFSGIMEIDWNDELSDAVRLIFLYSLRHRINSEDTYILFFAQLCHL